MILLAGETRGLIDTFGGRKRTSSMWYHFNKETFLWRVTHLGSRIAHLDDSEGGGRADDAEKVYDSH